MELQAFPARDGCLEVGHRCLAFSHLLTARRYSRLNPPDDSIGAHLRHCLDFLVCFRRGLEEGIVRYDQRDRNARISSEPSAFQEAMDKILEMLGRIEPGHASRVIEVRMKADSAGSSIRCASSVERELVFLSGHGLHHLAIARLLAEAQGVSVAEDLTAAFSTALHRKCPTVSESESVDV